jgi:hypothetical protein
MAASPRAAAAHSATVSIAVASQAMGMTIKSMSGARLEVSRVSTHPIDSFCPNLSPSSMGRQLCRAHEAHL